MKTLRHIFPGICLLATLLVSCIADPIVTVSEGQEVLVTVNAVTRAGAGAGDAEDREISEFRVLGYRMSDGQLAFNKPVLLTFNSLEEKYSGTIEVKTGSFNIVFIANEGSDGSTSTLLTDLAVGSSITDLQTVTFSHEAFASNKNIPMVTLKENVQIVGEDKLVDDGTQVNGEWSIPMKRLGVRIDMTLDKTGQTVTGNLTIQKVPNAVYLLSGQNNDATGYTTKDIAYTTDADNNDILIWERIILPESMFSPKNTKEKGVVLSLEVDGSDCKAVIGLDAFNETEQDRDYTLPRNTYLDITATAEPSDQKLNCEAIVKPWDVVSQKVIIDGQYFLKIEEDDLIFSDQINTTTIIAETNYDLTYNDQGFPPGVQIEKEQDCDWLTVSVNKEGNEKYTISLTSTANDFSRTLRKTKLYVKAGNMTKVINVMQWGYFCLVHPEMSYVGAFWRADQTGERLIKIKTTSSANDGYEHHDAKGAWKVSVYDYGDDFKEGDIVFSADESDDQNIYSETAADMNDSNNDAAYNVSGDNTSLTGSVDNEGDIIFFRIGLKSTWNPTIEKPVRYAVLILTYNDNKKYQKIFLRQGHDADFVMYPGDLDVDGNDGFSGRNYARKWSPYNLTSKYLTDDNPYYDQITSRGDFVNYPSQVGAFFQWGNYRNDYQRRAYHPSFDGSMDWIKPLTEYDKDSWIWREEIHETCPNGFRHHISTEGDNNEIFQSLAHKKISGNHIYIGKWGYYADGFFDRRDPVEVSGTSIAIGNKVVANGTKNAAYIGTLVFNPVHDSPRKNASIFFPAGGYRDIDSKLTYAGFGSYYSTKSSGNTNNNFRFWSINRLNGVPHQLFQKGRAVTVRCVVDETPN